MHISFLCLFLLLAVDIDAADMNKYYKRVGKKFLDEKAKDPNIIKLKSGMLVEILHEV